MLDFLYRLGFLPCVQALVSEIQIKMRGKRQERWWCPHEAGSVNRVEERWKEDGAESSRSNERR